MAFYGQQRRYAVADPSLVRAADAAMGDLRPHGRSIGVASAVLSASSRLLLRGPHEVCRTRICSAKDAGCESVRQHHDPLIARLRERKVLTPAVLIVSHLNAALRAHADKERVRLSRSPSWAKGCWIAFARLVSDEALFSYTCLLYTLEDDAARLSPPGDCVED
jgi:hypothetical protein